MALNHGTKGLHSISVRESDIRNRDRQQTVNLILALNKELNQDIRVPEISSSLVLPSLNQSLTLQNKDIS